MLINGLKSIKTKNFYFATRFYLYISIHNKKNGHTTLKASKIKGFRYFLKKIFSISLSILHRLTQSQNASKINAYRDLTTE